LPWWLVASVLLPFVACGAIACWGECQGDRSLSSPWQFGAIVGTAALAIVALVAYRRSEAPQDATPQLQGPADLRHAFRIAWYGGAAVVLIGYAVLLSTKWSIGLPIHMTWSRILVGPPLLAFMPAIWMHILQDERRIRWFWMGAWVVSIIGIIVLISYFDPVPTEP